MTKILVIIFTIAIVSIFAFSNYNDTNVSDEVVMIDSSLNQDVKSSNTTLDLTGQNLNQAPAYIFDNKKLLELNLSNNNLEGALQAEVRNLQNLKILNLSNNNFTGVPAEIGQLAQLEVLDLSNNNLTGLPYELGNLKQLKVLDLRGNDYSKVDLEIIKQGLSSDTQIFVD